MSEQPDQRAKPPERPKGDSTRIEREFRPKLSGCDWTFLLIFYSFGLFALFYLFDQFCLCLMKLPPSVFCTYLALSFVLAAFLVHRSIYHKIYEHKARLADRSLVKAKIVEASTVEPRLTEPLKPDNFVQKKKDLLREVNRLENELGSLGWTEYQVLPLYQQLVEFLKVDELIARATSSLGDLEEYAEDTAYRYDREQYSERKTRIEEGIKEITDVDDGPVGRDAATEMLRAEFRTLLEYVANYHENWAKGSAVVRALTISGVVAIPILLVMALLPLLHSAGGGILGILNWGLLGISGAITAVLLGLRKSDLVEIGNTEGKKELRRALLGTALGLVAGILAYSMIAGGILSGSAFPEIKSGPRELKDTALSIFWGIAAGFSFEWVFDRMRTTTAGES